MLASRPMVDVITARQKDLGDGFLVSRSLPVIGRKSIGPFVFFDHFGPTAFAPASGMDVRPHPHIGLATVTFLLEGAIEHRDNLGSQQVIRPGDVNWMTAGRGIAHSERTPQAERRAGQRLHGMQVWVALPKAHEETAPTFVHHGAATLPSFEQNGAAVRLLVGAAFGRESPVQVFSDTIYFAADLPAGTTLTVPGEGRELGAYVVNGRVRVEGQTIEARSLAVAQEGAGFVIEAAAPATLMVCGGERLPEPRFMWWNFVSTSKERIEVAKQDWASGRFAQVPGDAGEFIPLPG